MVRKVRVDALDDEFFDGAVGVGDPIVFGFFADLEVVGEFEAEEAGFHDGAGAESEDVHGNMLKKKEKRRKKKD